MPKVHSVKAWPEWYDLSVRGLKPFELRKDDRDYEVGDTLILREWDPQTQKYTGRQCSREIICKVDKGEWLTPGYCALGLRDID